MSLNEFDLIKGYFKSKSAAVDNDVCIGIGDDCAILDVPDGYQLAVSTDTLVSGVHFFTDVDPYRLGYKALAVNLSDLAAMGAMPKWISLAITLPEIDETWVSEFSRGFFELANKYKVSLVGGDTTKGPLSITVSVKGLIPRGVALRRDNASDGDLICVSGCLGDGALGLESKLKDIPLNDRAYFIDALELTDPQIKLGILLRDLASSCMDISDGLTQDLKHILKASLCATKIELEKLPLSAALKTEVAKGNITEQQALQFALTGGDDYELLFTIAADKLPILEKLIADYNINISVVGTIYKNKQPIIELFDNHKLVSFSQEGWDHFQQGKQ